MAPPQQLTVKTEVLALYLSHTHSMVRTDAMFVNGELYTLNTTMRHGTNNHRAHSVIHLSLTSDNATIKKTY